MRVPPSNLDSNTQDDDSPIDPRFYPSPEPEHDNIGNFPDLFRNEEDISENINLQAIANISQNEQNDSKKRK